MEERARYPEGRRQGRSLRELLHQGLPTGWRTRHLDSAHGSQASGGQEPKASIWFVLFDSRGRGAKATKVTQPASELSAPARRAPSGLTTPRWARDRAERFSRDRCPHRLLGAHLHGRRRALQVPAGRLALRGAAAETKFVAPFPTPSSRAGWKSTARDRADGWLGMIGHNWGTEHAERWVWLEGTGFADSPGTYFDAGAARVKSAPGPRPGSPSGMLVLDGEAHRLGGIGKIRWPGIGESPRLRLRPAGQGRRRPRPRLGPGRRSSSAGATPTRGPRAQHPHLLVADLELTVDRPGVPRPSSPFSVAAHTRWGCGRPTTDSAPALPGG